MCSRAVIALLHCTYCSRAVHAPLVLSAACHLAAGGMLSLTMMPKILLQLKHCPAARASVLPGPRYVSSPLLPLRSAAQYPNGQFELYNLDEDPHEVGSIGSVGRMQRVKVHRQCRAWCLWLVSGMAQLCCRCCRSNASGMNAHVCCCPMRCRPTTSFLKPAPTWSPPWPAPSTCSRRAAAPPAPSRASAWMRGSEGHLLAWCLVMQGTQQQLLSPPSSATTSFSVGTSLGQ